MLVNGNTILAMTYLFDHLISKIEEVLSAAPLRTSRFCSVCVCVRAPARPRAIPFALTAQPGWRGVFQQDLAEGKEENAKVRD